MNARLSRTARALLLAALSAAGLLACGKRGPPLPPLPGSVPRVLDLEVRQVGDEVRARFSLPSRPGQEEVDYATLGVELWRRDAETAADGLLLDLEEPAGLKDFTDGAVMADSASGDGLFDFLAVAQPELVDRTVEVDAGRSYEYALILKTSVRKRGTLSDVVSFTPLSPPAAPTGVLVEAQETGLIVRWTRPLLPARPAPVAPPETTEPPAEDESQDEAEDGDLSADDAVVAPSPGTMTFDVYRAVDDKAMSAEPANDRPIDGESFADGNVREGATYRYAVQALVEVDGVEVRSARSEEVSQLFADSFPPAVPNGLRIIREGRRAVNLLWNPNTEPDLAGYGVYRREVGGQWVRLDANRAKTATFSDGGIAADVSYEYAVSAHDASGNESERCEPRLVDSPTAVPREN